MTIKEVLDKTITFFKQKGFHSPRLDAELILAHGLGLERLQLYLKFDQSLKEPELEKLRELVKRRATSEPIAYILGKKDFYKNSFVVNKSVLIPRPETETLVEMAADFIESKKPLAGFNVLDIGGGSGCIGISLAKEFPALSMTIIEKSIAAVEVIKENMLLNQVGNVTVYNLDADEIDTFVQQHSGGKPMFDLIVSNPPYIDIDDKEVEDNVRKFEPHEALFADDRGHVFLKNWASKYSSLLSENGMMIFEMGYTQGDAILDHLTKLNIFKSVKIKKDLAAMDRFIAMAK
jgi:release factor glutamine methyltransferase